MHNVYSLHYIQCMYFSYMFRRNIHHHQGELVCPLLNTGYWYEAINYGFYISHFVNCKRYNSVHIGINIYTTAEISDVAPQCYC